MASESAILLIEEDDRDARLLQQCLADSGVSNLVCRFTCPSEAKAYLEAGTRDGGAIPAAIILALGLEARVGFEFVRWIRRQPHHHDLIVIMLGDLRRLREVQDAYASGVNAFFVKGPDCGALIRTLQSAFRPTPAALTHPAFRNSTDLYGGSERSDSERMTERATLLLVDDSEAHTKQFAQSLEALRLRNPFQRANGADEAIAYLSGSGAFSDRSSYPFPIIVFLDIRMQASHKLLAWLEAHPAGRPSGIIALTSSHDMRPVIQAYHLGVQSFLKEPLKLEELRNALQAIPQTEFRAEEGGYWIRPLRK